MAEAIASDLAVKLLEVLGTLAVQKLAPYFGGLDKLNELQLTMQMIQARLLDAERRREGEHGALVKLWLKRLKRVLYKLDDLFEDVSVADKEREHMDDGGLLTKPVRRLKSKTRRLKLNKKVSQEFNAITRELEEIRSDMGGLNFTVHSVEEQNALNFVNKRETHSFIMEDEVIGRKSDRSAIMEILFDPNHGDESVSVIPIVGIGGLGKTTLAQLVYNDKKVQQYFEIKCWACISETSGWQELAGRILKSQTRIDHLQLSMEELQSSLREAFEGKRYLLVLDDAWDGDRERWLQVRRLLCGGKWGSKILVTTRFTIVAEIMGDAEPYLLGGLSDVASWTLFASLAFRDGTKETNQNLVRIGKEIVKKCVNVPLAIRTIAGLLYSKHTEQEWAYFKDNELRVIQQNGSEPNTIMSTLKLSYDHLPPNLKQCFAYCSLFPKDYVFHKERLIWLWMAQGFIRPTGHQSQEAAGDEYFMELLRRGFFQDVIRTKFGRISGCKMHDLMHDLACEVGDECLLVEGSIEKINEDTRHVMLFSNQFEYSRPSSLLRAAKRMRSLLFPEGYCSLDIDYLTTIASRLKYLRVLELLDATIIGRISNSIGELKHLRYLKLCGLDEYVPDGITRLHKLETLDLQGSNNLKELPSRFIKLTSLRHLRIGYSLNEMPPSFGELTSLQTLDRFVVGKNNGLDALASLNLAGDLRIDFQNHRKDGTSEAKMANLVGKKLTSLLFEWSVFDGEELWASHDGDDEELECLQPPPTLENLIISSWKGVKLCGWRMDESGFPNLVSIEISSCDKCKYLPSLSRLPCLRHLSLKDLDDLEYIEHGSGAVDGNAASSTTSTYCPSLEELELRDLPELKGWSSAGDSGNLFPQLSRLVMWYCPKLMSMPLVPKVRSLYVYKIYGALLDQLLVKREERGLILSSSSSSCLSSTYSELKYLNLTAVLGLHSLSSLLELLSKNSTLEHLLIDELDDLEALPESIGNLTHLRSLSISHCNQLSSFPNSFRNLTALQSLDIWGCPTLEWHDKSWPLDQRRA